MTLRKECACHNEERSFRVEISDKPDGPGFVAEIFSMSKQASSAPDADTERKLEAVLPAEDMGELVHACREEIERRYGPVQHWRCTPTPTKESDTVIIE
ncbi:MAG: hypothetical protein JXR37_35425 [Kiritimatiellae bacterium]|nr:hypothetical protein [Kiritimatiellia bacterium]